MLTHLYRHWAYTNAAVEAVRGMVEDGLVTYKRAQQLLAALNDQERLAASIAGLASGRVANAAHAVACDCSLIYQDALSRGETATGDYLKLAARALLLPETH